jgi:ABC-2 type transport system permease protein
MWMITVGLAFTIVIPISLSGLTAPKFVFDWGPVIGGYLGLLLLSATFVATGMWASALTRNQIVSFILGLAICFVLIIIDSVSFFLPEGLGAVVQYLSASFHFQNISRGVIDSRDLVYYFSMTAIGLRLTIGALRAARR